MIGFSPTFDRIISYTGTPERTCHLFFCHLCGLIGLPKGMPEGPPFCPIKGNRSARTGGPRGIGTRPARAAKEKPTGPNGNNPRNVRIRPVTQLFADGISSIAVSLYGYYLTGLQLVSIYFRVFRLWGQERFGFMPGFTNLWTGFGSPRGGLFQPLTKTIMETNIRNNITIKTIMRRACAFLALLSLAPLTHGHRGRPIRSRART